VPWPIAAADEFMMSFVSNNLTTILTTLALLFACGCVGLAYLIPYRRRAKRPHDCPECRYDLASTENKQCPECGYLAPNERAFRRLRPVKALFVLASVFLIASTFAIRTSHFKNRGWRGVMPSYLLLTVWPVRNLDWMGGTYVDPTVDEISNRLNGATEDQVGFLLKWVWIKRTQIAFLLPGRPLGWNEPTEPTLTISDVKDLCDVSVDAELEESAPDTARMYDRLPNAKSNTRASRMGKRVSERDLVDVLAMVVTPDQWIFNGGTIANYQFVDSTLIVMHTPEGTAQTRAVLATLESLFRTKQPQQIMDDQGRAVLFLRLGKQAQDRTRESDTTSFSAELASAISPETWELNGGEGTISFFADGGYVFIRHQPEIIAECVNWLESRQILTASEVAMLNAPSR
jgi:hypothetical protein